ncbi:TetR/AcrR family transcriptional regulator [Rhodococcoides yunnanense]|jgi:AcrR family transcriptional regulator|uniref:TetR/AcrR family transcriptional regulator n=1 Tax=Rhodococcoides yunnanense TaxID=278209 RepID=UPI0022B1BDA7|nr:TetR/AcrR family transcriptional regulator [Rhodococcus yunnanensis]MCZ4278489.1 TetR/AcrR family transcriptional regulator [Rhodococcus yunnanensis]
MTKIAAAADSTPREAIVRVATELFGRKSYPGTSVRDIAGEVGLLAGSLYAHIAGKEALLLEIIEHGIEEFYEQVMSAFESEGTADDKLRAMILAHVRVVAKQPQRTQIVFHQWRYLSEENQRRVRERRSEYESLFTLVLEKGVADGSFASDIDVKITVLSILGSLNWTPEWLSSDGPTSVEELSVRLSDAMMKGVLGR